MTDFVYCSFLFIQLKATLPHFLHSINCLSKMSDYTKMSDFTCMASNQALLHVDRILEGWKIFNILNRYNKAYALIVAWL